MVLLTYLLNAYPRGVRVSRMVDPLVRSIMEGAVPYSFAAHAASSLNTYSQADETSAAEFKGEWQSVNQPACFVSVFSVQ